MNGSGDDDYADWSGRPQDDPRLIAAAKAARAAYRAAHPPVDCWIDAVMTMDLYLDGRHRARVFTSKARAHILDDSGNPTESITYLRSETPFGAVERHLGIRRVSEIRDDSDEGGGEISTYPRKRSARFAREFRASCPPAGEAAHYLREAVNTYEFFGGNAVPFAREWRGLIGGALDAIAANDREAAHGIVLMALSGMNEDMILDWQVAWVDCARGAEALRRDLKKENPRKSGG